MLTTGFVSYMQKLVGGGVLLVTGLVLILLIMFVWWRDIIREATFEGHYSFVVQRGLRFGIGILLM
jgi:cytochrome c oxidase subunit III